MSKRKSIGDKVRFEVFKRDSFACQYCGAKAPDVVLNVDHIHPVSQGGGNDIINLITSCRDCNSGKSDRSLSDSSVLAKQRQQLEDLEERRAQLEMMVEWQRSLVDLDADITQKLGEFWASLGSGYSLNDIGLGELRQALSRFSADELIAAMRSAASQYFVVGQDGKTDIASVNRAWGFILKIASVNRQSKTNPHVRDVLYTRGILRRRFSYINEHEARRLLQQAVDLGISVEELKRWACDASNWSNWKGEMLVWIAEVSA
jgi:hypothetical protein